TGTITTGKPVVTDTYFSQKVTSDEQRHYEEMIVSMESKSNHPLAQAIITHYEHVQPVELTVDNVIGVGLVASENNRSYKIGKPSSYEFIPDDLEKQTALYEEDGKTVVYFGLNDEVLALIAIQDIPK